MTSLLSEIEADIEVAKCKLADMKKESKMIDSVLELAKEGHQIQGHIKNDMKFTEGNAEALEMIEGVHSWKLLRADESNVAIEFLGSAPELCFRVNFSVSASGKVDCKTTNAIQNGNRKMNRIQFTPSVRSFFVDKVDVLRKDLSLSQLNVSSDIVEVVQRTEWFLGRLDIIGKEISMLEIRYNGSLKRVESSALHALNLSIDNKPTGKTVETTFEIGDWYPFVLDVDVSGDVDTLSIENHLTQNAKPGFGYLSRTCDIIAAASGASSSR